MFVFDPGAIWEMRFILLVGHQPALMSLAGYRTAVFVKGTQHEGGSQDVCEMAPQMGQRNRSFDIKTRKEIIIINER